MTLTDTRLTARASGPAAGPAIDPVLRAKAEEAARKFEGMFITEMLRGMRRGTRELADEDSPLRNRTHEDMLDLADTLVADALAGQRAFGIADVLLRQLLPAQRPAGTQSEAAFKSADTAVAQPSK